MSEWVSEWVKSLSHVWLFATPWIVAYQAPPSMGFSRQEYWNRLPIPSPGDLPDPGITPRSPALEADALTSESLGKPIYFIYSNVYMSISGGSLVKNLPANAGDTGSISGSGRFPWRRKWQPTLVAWEITWTEEIGGLQSQKREVITKELDAM